MKLYTKTGDDGTTSLLSGVRVQKSHFRLEAYGLLDSLNSQVGVSLSYIKNNNNLANFLNADLELLENLQGWLFSYGSLLSCDKDAFLSHLPPVQERWTELLEQAIDKHDQELPVLKNFILPGGSIEASHMHTTRSLCRLVERNLIAIKGNIDNNTEDKNLKTFIFACENCIQLLNRTSDYFFSLARYCNLKLHTPDIPWIPNEQK